MLRLLALTVPLMISPLASAAAIEQSADTVKAGSLALRVPVPGIDTIDSYAVTATGQTLSPSPTVTRRTREQVGSRNAIRIATESGPASARSRFDYFLDAKTLEGVRFEQRTPIDSAVLENRNGCATGWTHLQNQARRELPCDPDTGRFPGGALAVIVAGLPLAEGRSFVIATRSIVEVGWASVSVKGAESLTMGGREFRVWKVEWRSTSQFGTNTTVFFVDREQPRVLKTSLIFENASGNRREFLNILRNP
jgi:hypothetical protein